MTDHSLRFLNETKLDKAKKFFIPILIVGSVILIVVIFRWVVLE